MDTIGPVTATMHGNGAARPRGARPSGVRVRVAEDRDWPALRELVRKHHRRTVFADMPFSEKKFDEIEARLKAPAKHEWLIVAEAKGKIVGGAWFSAGEYMLCEGALMTTVHIIAVDTERCGPYLSAKTFMRLVHAIVIWSHSRGATQVLVHVTTGTAIKATDRLLQRGGAKCLGGGYLISA